MEWSTYSPPAAVAWITVLTDKYSSQLLEQLVTMGYTVSACMPNCLATGHESSVAYVIAINLSHKKLLNASTIMTDIKLALFNIRAFYYSIVTLVEGGVVWSAGNIIVQFIDPFNPPQMPKKKNHLRLVKNETLTQEKT